MDIKTQSTGLSLVTGPAWAGKTNLVTQIYAKRELLTWIGTASADDPALVAHVATIRSKRPSTWKTLDAPIKLPEMIRSQSSERVPLIIDSVSLWMGNLASVASTRYSAVQTADFLQDSSQDFLESVNLQLNHRAVICISAEMGASVAPDSAIAYELRRAVGLLNQTLAALAHQVVTVTCGIGTSIK